MSAKTLVVVGIGCIFWASAPALAIDFQFGLKGGLNHIQTDLENPPSDQDRSAISTPTGGLVFSFGFNDVVGVDADLLYVRKGVHTKSEQYYEGFTQGEEADLHLDYVVISPLLKIGGRAESLSPYFLGGVELGILLDATSQSTSWNGNPRTTWEHEYDFKEYMQSTAWAWTVGAGVEIPTRSVSVLLESRYVQGVNNIWTEENTHAWGAEKPKGFYVLGGVRF